MEPSTEFKNGSTKKKPQRKESSSDQLLSDTQEKMEHMEITKPTRRNRKRKLVEESDDSEEQGDEVQNMEDEKPSQVKGAMDRFITKSAEASQPTSL